jgi:phosphoglucomutase
MSDYRNEYHKWCRDTYFDKNTRKELLELRDEEEIRDRFYRELEFGTGGLRGVMGAGLNRMNCYTVRKATQGLANYLKQQKGEKKTVIAYDSRHNSSAFAMEAALCLCANGIRVFLFDGLRPTPELSFAVRKLGCMAGIMVTASHNPPEYNGYKIYWEDGAQITWPRDMEILKEVKAVTDFSWVKSMCRKKAESAGLLRYIGKEMDALYLNALKALMQEPEILQEGIQDLKIVYTPLHGTGNMPVRRILKELGFENVYIVEKQEQPDGDFPTVKSPNPEDEKVFAMALTLAREVDADLVLATDPDADRLGVYVKDGKTGEYMAFTGNMSGMIICEYLLSRRKEMNTLPENGAIVTTIVSGKMAKAACREYGVMLIETLTGFKYIGEQIRLFEEQGTYEYLFGFEESYGCLVGTNSRDKDAIGAVMTFCEAAVYYRKQGLTLWDQMENLYRKYGYYKESLHTIVKTGPEGAAEISGLMEEMRRRPFVSAGGFGTVEFYDYREGSKIRLQDGAKEQTGLPRSDVLYYVLEEDSWICIRPSGTEPKVKIYTGTRGETQQEAEDRLSAIWNEVERRLGADMPDCSEGND